MSNITHTINASTTTAGGTTFSGRQTETGGSELTIDQFFPAGTTAFEIDDAVTAANVQSICMLSDKGCVVKTNSSSSPANTFTLAPGYPLIWSKSAAYYANPITTNITKFFIDSTLASRLQIKILTNP